MTNEEKLAALSAAGLEIVPLVLKRGWDETLMWGLRKTITGEWIAISPNGRGYHEKRKQAVEDLRKQWEAEALSNLRPKAKVKK